MKTKFLHILGPFLGLLLFTIALGVLYHQLRTYHLHDILHHLHNLPGQALLVALLLTVLSYFIMTGYDVLALRYISHPISYGKTALASFLGYAFSNNIGFSMIAGASVRYRLYTAWGLTAFEITQVVGFCILTLWLGFFALGGVVFLFEPLTLPGELHLPFSSAHILGGVLLAIAAGFVLWSLIMRKPVRIRDWGFAPPSPGLLLGQITVASLDWLIAGSVLYILMPSRPEMSYPAFIGVFMAAQLAGLISQVPGGLGVFETAVILLLSPIYPATEIIGSLLAYRGLYYILPLLTAAVLLGTHELFRYRTLFGGLAKTFGRWMSFAVPQVLAFTTFVGGAIMLFSGATPAISGRLSWLQDVMPLPVIEISHFLGSLVGGGLILLARGLQRRIDSAYFLTVLLLGCGIIVSLLKGLDYEEAMILAVMLGALLPCRRHFYRSASLFKMNFNAGWLAGIAAVFICFVWLGFFSYKHVEFSNDLWWRFTLAGDASRFLRATIGAASIVLFFTLARMLSPSPPVPVISRQEEMDRAAAIVEDYPRAFANLALLGDKSFLFSRKGNAFIMYGIEGRSWVGMGDPIGSEDEWSELLWQFRQIADRYGGWSVFYEVSSKKLHLYLDFGLTLFKLGEEARVPLEGFSLDGSARKGLRYTAHKLERQGYHFQMVPREEAPSLLPELKRISDAWLEHKNTGEKGFSLGFFDEEYLKHFPVGVLRNHEGRILVFTNVWSGGGKEELSIDLMRFHPDAPSGAMDYLFIQLMLWGKTQGYQWFNLGMAPLSGLEDYGLAPLWNRVGAYVFQHGEHFYNFQGLRQYKEKFGPEWTPKYVACPGGLVFPRILVNVASLISGGLKGVVAK